jgi:hypothetical protein
MSNPQNQQQGQKNGNAPVAAPTPAPAPVEAKTAPRLASDKIDFDEISTEVEAWWSHKDKGASIVGRLIGYRAMSDGGRFYVLKTVDPTFAVRKGETEPVEVPAETIVGVRDSRALSDLRFYVEGKAVVKVVFLEKVKINGNKTFNTFKIHVARGAVKAVRPAQAMGGGNNEGGSEDEIPF